ncbi:hypothetical protein MNEG_6976 [Monoraphidium neglectum]|jgi:hypothetical protein|uniref:Uncharacterized protein n=1 Tax=Monoraphidium neglectum TaxID=145388 RepID=A0A0D2JPB7_9CHLO|nr:hypothetical protein MNEG_6976 [Monoraphidium neglectum]KIZ00988.1 hypothetical protein MNEG_6976 [Monoraphidium neglectum]|eukprot:XP_013900007.1 hypothetical protein MNEG_6976 [Monoraphidium neglectum]
MNLQVLRRAAVLGSARAPSVALHHAQQVARRPVRPARAAYGNDSSLEAWQPAVNPTAPNPPAPADPPAPGETETFETTSRDAYYTRRHELVLESFPNALGVDDFISRVEIALAAHGFRGDNAIGARARAP